MTKASQISDFEFKENALYFVFGVVLFLYPSGIGLIESWASSGYFFLFLLSTVYFYFSENKINFIEIPNFLPVCLFFTAIALSAVNIEEWYHSFKMLGKFSLLLLTFPIIRFVQNSPIGKIRLLASGLLVSGFFIGLFTFYMQSIEGKGRWIGHYNPIIFGDLSILTAVLLICAALCGLLQRWQLALLPFSIASALYASLLSLTRGGWIAVPLVIGFLLMLHYKIPSLNSVKRWIGLLSMAAVIVVWIGAALVFSDKLEARWKRTYENFSAYLTEDNVRTSVGVRLELWRISFDIWRDKPFVGTGLGDFEHDVARWIEEDRTGLKRVMPHAHNVFFDTLARTGLFGLVTMLMALMIAPWRYLYRALKSAESAERRFACMGGMALVFCYVVFGLTEAVFSRSAFMATYCFFLAVFIGAARPYETYG